MRIARQILSVVLIAMFFGSAASAVTINHGVRTPSVIDFGDVALGTSVTRTVTMIGPGQVFGPNGRDVRFNYLVLIPSAGSPFLNFTGQSCNRGLSIVECVFSLTFFAGQLGALASTQLEGEASVTFVGAGAPPSRNTFPFFIDILANTVPAGSGTTTSVSGVPLPGSLSMLGLALVALGGGLHLSRRRRG